jgi:hypothetical protein
LRGRINWRRLGALVSIPFVSLYAFWLAIIGYIVLAAACMMKGM